MLSRVAESLYWTSRYIERAEDLTRLLSVNFHALLDIGGGEAARRWRRLIALTGDETIFARHFEEASARSVSEFMLWHPANPNAVAACVDRARENARGVREIISSEMWQQLNRLRLLVRGVSRDAVLAGPHEFFGQVRDGSQAFQGIAGATMTHGEAYQFIQLGKYLERAEKTVRILDVEYETVSDLSEGSPEASLQLTSLLRSCSAFEPFRRASAPLQVVRVVEYLLLNREFPRAVQFCLERCRWALDAVAGAGAPDRSARKEAPQRAVGRLCADLQYLDLMEVVQVGLRPYLRVLLERINATSDEIARCYFNTQVILPGAKPDEQQQQQ